MSKDQRCWMSTSICNEECRAFDDAVTLDCLIAEELKELAIAVGATESCVCGGRPIGPPIP